MRKLNQTVFDEHLQKGTDHTHAVFTSSELNAKLGQFDQLAVQVVLDNVSGSPIGGFDLFVEHSADGRNFVLARTGGNNPPANGPGDVSIATLSASTVNVAWGPYDGKTPLLGFVRFRMFFSNKTTAAHVRVHVTLRDQGG